MKMILNDYEISEISSTVNGGLSPIPEAYLEKDIILTSMIHQLSDVKIDGAKLLFCGGTSLSKGYHVIERMSEDVDFKIVFPDEYDDLTSSTQRKLNSIAMRSLLNEFNRVGITLEDGVQPMYHNTFLRFYNKYNSCFENTNASLSLRGKGVKVEFITATKCNHHIFSINTITGELLAKPPICNIACQAIEETFCEKAIGLLRRLSDKREYIAKNNYLMRHVYDMAMISRGKYLPPYEELVDIFAHIIEGDIKRYDKFCPDFVADPCGTLRSSLKRLREDKSLEKHFIEGVQNFIYGQEDIRYHDMVDIIYDYILNLIDAYEDMNNSFRHSLR